MELAPIRFLITFILLLQSSYNFPQNQTIENYFYSLEVLEKAEELVEKNDSKKAYNTLESIKEVPLDYLSTYYRIKSFIYFIQGEIDSSFYYAIESKKANLFEYYSNYFLEIFDTIPNYKNRLKTEFDNIDSLKRLRYFSLDSLINFIYNNDQCAERVLLGQGKYKSEKEKDSLQQIEILKDHQNKLILDSIINKHIWIGNITPTVSFRKWDIIVIHGNQKYIMKYVKKGYFLALENKADWKSVISFMSWSIAPHRKENKDNYDILPLLSISLNNENYQNFLAYSFQEVISNFKQIGHEKGNKLTLSVPKFQYKDFKKIYKKALGLGLKPEQLLLEKSGKTSSALYKYELIE